VHVTSLERLSQVSPKSDDEVSMHLCSTVGKRFSFLSAIQGKEKYQLIFTMYLPLVAAAHFILAFHRTLPAMPTSFNLKEPCVLYIGQAYHYPPDVAFYIYIFFQQI
jgi:hypothetical protein